MSAKVIFVFLVTSFLVLPCQFAFSQSNNTESLTITTYYPAPYGVYHNLKLSPTKTVPFGTALSEGVMYYDANDHKLKIWSCTDQPACTTLGWLNITDSTPASVPANSTGSSLVWGLHTEGDCSAAGGTPVASDTGLKQCQFPTASTSCPAGWNHYKNYFASAAQTATCYTRSRSSGCSGSSQCMASGGGGVTSCVASAPYSDLAFGNNNPCQCVSCGCGPVCGSCNCNACLSKYTFIGCY